MGKWTAWWFLRRPWASAGIYPRPPIKAGSERMLILRGSFMRVCVEVSFPWGRA